MKKQALKAITMLVSIIALAFMTAVVSNAQSRSTKLRANIPFDFVVGDKVFKAFKEFVASRAEDYKVTDAQLDRQRDFIARQMRYDLTTAAYGSVKATQVLVFDDPQVTKAIESLPRARDLATAAMRGRNPQSRSFE